MNRELISLFAAFHLPGTASGGTEVGERNVSALNKEIAMMGYTLTSPLFNKFKTLTSIQFQLARQSLLDILRDVSGTGMSYGVLFNKFPYNTPDQRRYLTQRIIGYIENTFGIGKGNRVLDCGHVIDTGRFDFDEFGACPICQFQVNNLESPDIATFPCDRVTRLQVLHLAADNFVSAKATELLGRNGSLSDLEKTFIKKAAACSMIKGTRPTTVFRETLPFLYSIYNDAEYIKTLVSGATDVLRIASFISDDKADLSLASNTRFRISTRHRKKLLAVLDGTDNLAADMMRHREKWLRLGEELHPGSLKNSGRFPKVAAAFDQLRNDPGSIDTFARFVEKGIRGGIIDEAYIKRLATRPGEFMRRIDVLLRRDVPDTAIMQGLSTALPGVPTKMLFEVRKYLMHRLNDKSGKRVFMPKGSVTKMQIVDDLRPKLQEHTGLETIGAITAELFVRLQKLGPIGRVAIDPALRKIVLPFNTRGDSETNVAVIKGSAYPMFSERGGPVVRLFAYWKQSTDLDLSCMFLNDDFVTEDHVSYTNLRSGDTIHSGDIIDGSLGAAEYIDFNVQSLRAKGYRYLVSTLISFRGLPFDEYEECFAGFMERDAMKSGQRFEPTSVALKFKVAGKHKQHMPLIFDLKEQTVIFADIASGMGHHGRIEAGDKTSMLARSAVELPFRKPTAYDVIAAHVVARGGKIVSAIEEHDRRFDLTSDVHEIVREFAS